MRNPGLEEAQAGIKIARRNINNLRCADDTTLMEDSEGQGSLGMLQSMGLQRVRNDLMTGEQQLHTADES